MLTAALLLFPLLARGRNIILHCIQQKLIKASGSAEGLALTQIYFMNCNGNHAQLYSKFLD